MVVGTRFWYVAAFAVASLLKQIDRELVVKIYSDGSLTPNQQKALAALPIQAVFPCPEELRARIDIRLPMAKYPHLRERLKNYPHIKKLIYPHVGSLGPKIVIDADVLFFGRPNELWEWQSKPEKPLVATDLFESYGYPREFLNRITGGCLPKKVNVGITGLVSETINWDELEKWCAQLKTAYGFHYYLEQALIAMMCVRTGAHQLSQDRYITGPTEEQALSHAGVMQHYVDLSKKWYFRELWRGVAGENMPRLAGMSPSSQPSWLDKLHPQKKKYPAIFGITKDYLYRKPKDEIKRMCKWGLLSYLATPAWAREMEKAAERLPPLPVAENKPTREVWFLSGREHWFQTAFCAWTFQRWSRFRVVPMIVDDGTFDAEVQGKFAKVFPQHRLFKLDDCNRQFALQFPAEKYPLIQAVREKQVLFRKLTKGFGRADEWRFLMDSDMLFFSEPKEIDDLLAQRTEIFTQKDCVETYGYPRALLERLAGQKLPEAINIGIVQYNGARTDWDRVENWLTEVISKHGMAYNITQGTFAMILARQNVRTLPAEDYKVYPRAPRPGDPLPICGHYVADSKPWYFRQGWRKALELAEVGNREGV